MTGLTSDSAAAPHAGGELLSSGPPPRELQGRVRGAAAVALLIVGVLVGGGGMLIRCAGLLVSREFPP